jgi:glycosyltransferase involved in cell wall biosynthesis
MAPQGTGGSVTVVIPTRDRQNLLQRAIGSALQQRDVDVEIVVVDDGGTDGTAELVRTLGLPRVRLLRHERSRGVSAARNAGLAAAETRWVAFLDDDDVWAPTKLSAQLGELDRVPGAIWSCVGALHVDGSLRVITSSPPPASGELTSALSRGPAVPGGGSGVLVETALARAAGGFDEGLSILADWDFYLRLSLSSPVASVPEPLLGYYVHADSMYHDPRGVARELSALRVKHSGLDGGFRPDLAHWYVRLARMAQSLGNRRAAVQLLRTGVREAGLLPVLRQVHRRFVRRVRTEDGSVVPSQEAVAWLEDVPGNADSVRVAAGGMS